MIWGVVGLLHDLGSSGTIPRAFHCTTYGLGVAALIVLVPETSNQVFRRQLFIGHKVNYPDYLHLASKALPAPRCANPGILMFVVGLNVAWFLWGDFSSLIEPALE